MKKRSGRSNRIRWKGKVSNHGAAIKRLKSPGDAVLVERGRPRSLVCMCPCGCGDELTLNLDDRIGKAWDFFLRTRGFSLYPSVWRDSGCESHFVIWNSRVFWLDGNLWFKDVDIREMSKRILPILRKDKFMHFREISHSLREVPWAVLSACKELARKGSLIEGENDQSGYFKKS